MKQVQVQNEDTPLAIQSIENKGDGVVVVKVQVPPGTNKEKIHQDFNQNYQLALEAVEAKYKAQLAAKDNEIAIYREKSADLKEIIALQATRPIHVEAKAMTNSSDQSREFTVGDVGGDFKPIGSPILADNANISGTVAETINQLPSSPQADKPGIKELLQQLKTAIDAPDLSDDDKQQALEQLKTLAEAAQNPKDETMQKKAKKAIGFLKVIAEGLEPVTKLVMAFKDIIPAIAACFGL
jgi:hypothetical protein